MAGSTIGNIFKIMTWGESHGQGVGVVVDGCPAGIELSEEDIQVMLDRRKPVQPREKKQMKLRLCLVYLKERRQERLYP